MNKLAILGTELYNKTIGSNPLLETGTLGTAGGALGYYGGGFAASKMLAMLMAGKSPEERAEAYRQLREDGTIDLIKNIGGGLGALGGVGYGLQKNIDMRNGLSGMFDSLTSGKHWSDPQVQDRLKAVDAARQNALKTQYSSTSYSSGRTPQTAGGMQKEHALSDGIFGMNDALLDRGISSFQQIPIRQAMSTVDRDPFLSPPQKEIVNTVLSSTSDGDSGVTTGKSLMQSALQLGVGATAGYLFGRAAGSLFSLPPAVTDRLSTSGAVAGALVNTGIFSELL